jgi:hypothetical protein
VIFPLRTARWARILSMTRKRSDIAEVTDDHVNVKMGWVGHAEIPIARITRVSAYRWPWYGGLGVRIAKGMVAFVPVPGEGTLIELDGKITVHAPASWETERVLVAVEDHAAFAEAIAARRMGSGP